MKKILIAAVLLLGMSTALQAQVYDDPFAAKAVHNAHQDAALRGWKLSIDGGGQRVLAYKDRSFNNTRFDAEFGYRFNRSNYLGVSIGISSYNYTKDKTGLNPVYPKKSKMGVPLSLIYRGYFVTEQFASPYLYVRGNYCTSQIEDVNLGVGLGIEFLHRKVGQRIPSGWLQWFGLPSRRRILQEPPTGSRCLADIQRRSCGRPLHRCQRASEPLTNRNAAHACRSRFLKKAEMS